jgi:hypothetical protein
MNTDRQMRTHMRSGMRPHENAMLRTYGRTNERVSHLIQTSSVSYRTGENQRNGLEAVVS